MAKNRTSSPTPVWNGPSYALVPEGCYQAGAVRYQGPEWVRAYRRWSLLVEFELLDDGSLVCAFYNFGDNPSNPKVFRGGNYFKAWTLANGELPRKNQAMSPEVFLDGQLYTVEVKNRQKNAEGKSKSDAEIYSVVAGIIEVDRRY